MFKFCWHKWLNWLNDGWLRIYDEDHGYNPGDIPICTYQLQKRYCEKCDKVKRRRVKV
jgi:hypothetical protein